MGANTAKMGKSYYIKWIICAVLGGIFLLFPEQGIYTHEVKLFFSLTVLSLALVAFELVGELVIGVLLPSLYCFFNVAPPASSELTSLKA